MAVWKQQAFGAYRASLGPGLEMDIQYSVTKGEGYVGTVFGNKVKGSAENVADVQRLCEAAAKRLLKEATERLYKVSE
jgi:hypothetical protein